MNKELSKIINFLDAKKNYEASKLLILILKSNNLESKDFLYLGIRFINLTLFDESLSCFERCLEINPTHYSAYTNIGVIYFKHKKNYEKAIYFFKKSISLNKKNALALFNLACCYGEIDKFDISIKYFYEALKVNPEYHNARYNLGLSQLTTNDFKNGWKNYESRKKVMDIKEEILNIPKENIWNGKTKEIFFFVHSEQGIGDEILISSVYNDLKNIHKNIYISCDERLINLFKRNFDKINFFDKNSQISVTKKSKHIFSFSLGQYLRKDKYDFISNNNSWINTDPQIDKKIHFKFNKLYKKKVGIAWQSSEDKRKNISMLELCKIIPQETCDIINLQYGDVKNDILNIYNELNKNVIYFDDINYKDDFESLCSIISQCDIIITSSNVTAHFAGALGVDTFLLLPFKPFWYWGCENRTLWYPKINILRQKKSGDWRFPFQKLEEELKNRFC